MVVMADSVVEHEICGNCKREIPQSNYVMHTAHCARNITLCQVCKEPIVKSEFESHAKICVKKAPKSPEPPKTNLENSSYYQSRKEVQDKKLADRKEKYLERHEKFLSDSSSRKFGSNLQSTSSSSSSFSAKNSSFQSSNVRSTNSVHSEAGIASKINSNGTGAIKKEDKTTNGSSAAPKQSSGLMPCRYCELELPKVELEEHENYCGSRTDKCLECGQLVMFKHKQVHLDTNHGFVKMNDGNKWTSKPYPVAKNCIKKKAELPKTNLEKSNYYQWRKGIEDEKFIAKRFLYLNRRENSLAGSTSRKLGSFSADSTPVNSINVGNNSTLHMTGYTANKMSLKSTEEKKANGTSKYPKNNLYPANYHQLSKEVQDMKLADIKIEEKNVDGTAKHFKNNLGKKQGYQLNKEIQDEKLGDRREKYIERQESLLSNYTSTELGLNPQSINLEVGIASGKTLNGDSTSKHLKKDLGKNQNYQLSKEIQDKKLGDQRKKNIKSQKKLLSNSTLTKFDSNPEITSTLSGSFSAKNNSFKSINEDSTNTIHSEGGSFSDNSSNGTGAIKKKEQKTESSSAVIKSIGGCKPLICCKCGYAKDRCSRCEELELYYESGKASWESTTQKSHSPPRTRRVFSPAIYTDFSQFDPTDYLPSNYRIPKPKIEKGESYKEISRRLDCKTEYIRNLLHDSASITVPLRHSGAVPRNHFNHNKGPAPQPPSRRRNPPSELCIPCEFCDTPIPHMDLVLHETGCRPDLFTSRSRARNFDFDDFEARAPSPLEEPMKKKSPQPSPPKSSRRKRQPMADLLIPCEFCDDPIPEDDLIQHQTGCRPDLAKFGGSGEATASTPEVELPCEFCADLFPASKLYRHQATCG